MILTTVGEADVEDEDDETLAVGSLLSLALITLSRVYWSWTCFECRRMAMISPIRQMPISRRYSLFRSISMSIWMRFSTNVWAYEAAAAFGTPAASKNLIQEAFEGKSYF